MHTSCLLSLKIGMRRVGEMGENTKEFISIISISFFFNMQRKQKFLDVLALNVYNWLTQEEKLEEFHFKFNIPFCSIGY